jgi:hypothetical protein
MPHLFGVVARNGFNKRRISTLKRLASHSKMLVYMF